MDAHIAINMHINVTVFSSLRQETQHGVRSKMSHRGRLKYDILGRLKIGSLRSKSLTYADSSTNIRQAQNRQSQQIRTIEQGSLTKAGSNRIQKQSKKEAEMANKQTI